MKNAVVPIRNNCFNFIRLLAALQVFFGHAYAHLGLNMSAAGAQLWNILRGVPVFFILSGFLLWTSLERDDSLKKYCTKRIARLYPELWIGVLVNAIIILIVYGSRIEAVPFIAHIFTQSTVLQFWTPDFLRDYGCGTPNGALWTIGVMVQCYAVFYLVFKLLRKRKWNVQLTAFVLAVGCNFLPHLTRRLLPETLAKLFEQTFVPYFWMFLAGGLMAAYFEKMIGFLKKWWFLFLAVSVAFGVSGLEQRIGAYELMKSLTLGLAVVGFAYRYPKLELKNDYSYGFYIYHMIVINLMIHLGLTGKLWHLAVALAGSLLCAAASFHIRKAMGRVRTRLVN